MRLTIFIDQLTKILEKHNSNELFINGPESLVVCTSEQPYLKVQMPNFGSSLLNEIQNFAFSEGVRLDPNFPANGGLFTPKKNAEQDSQESYRWHAVMDPIADSGPFFTLRKHNFLSKSVYFEGCEYWPEICSLSIKHKVPIIICGATGTGKSTLLATILKNSCLQSRVVFIENVKELPMHSPLWIRLVETSPLLEGGESFSSRKLLFESLRMRPDHIVLGELRGIEARAFLQAFISGHGGILTTIHCDGPKNLLTRLDELSDYDIEEGKWASVFNAKGVMVISLEKTDSHKVKSIDFYQQNRFIPISSIREYKELISKI